VKKGRAHLVKTPKIFQRKALKKKMKVVITQKEKGTWSHKKGEKAGGAKKKKIGLLCRLGFKRRKKHNEMESLYQKGCKKVDFCVLTRARNKKKTKGRGGRKGISNQPTKNILDKNLKQEKNFRGIVQVGKKEARWGWRSSGG